MKLRKENHQPTLIIFQVKQTPSVRLTKRINQNLVKLSSPSFTLRLLNKSKVDLKMKDL